jgi:hypothetical protein
LVRFFEGLSYAAAFVEEEEETRGVEDAAQLGQSVVITGKDEVVESLVVSITWNSFENLRLPVDARALVVEGADDEKV